MHSGTSPVGIDGCYPRSISSYAAIFGVRHSQYPRNYQTAIAGYAGAVTDPFSRGYDHFLNSGLCIFSSPGWNHLVSKQIK